MQQSIGEALSLNLCRTVTRRFWQDIAHPLGEGTALFTDTVSAPLTLRCSTDVTGLRLLTHPWSGTARVTVGDAEIIVPLAGDGSPAQVLVPLPRQTHSFNLSIEALAIEGRGADRLQVWVIGIDFDDPPAAIPRAQVLNDAMQIVYGDWGQFIAFRHDDYLPNAIARDGAWAPADIALFAQHVRPGDVALDVGANIGHHSVVLSKLVGETGMVIAIEAQRALYQLVQANAALNRRSNIFPIHAAAGAEQGVVEMYPVDYDGELSFGALSINYTGADERNPGERVARHPLDTLILPLLGGRKVDFVKIDVQAYELFVLQGMKKILTEDRPTLFVEFSPFWMLDAGYAFPEIYHLLFEHGYELTHTTFADLVGKDGIMNMPVDAKAVWDVLAVHPSRKAARQCAEQTAASEALAGFYP